MRILLLNYEYPPLGGGAGVAAAALGHGLAERGLRVDVLTAANGRHAGHDVGSERVCDGLTVYRVKTHRKGVHQAGAVGAGGYLLGAVPRMRRLVGTRRYDVAHLFFSLPTGAVLPFAGLGDLPVVVSLRGSDVPGYDRCKPALQRAHRVLLPMTRWIWRRADRVIAVCESLGRLAQQTDPGLRVDVIRNGVDLELFRPPDVPRPPHTRPIRCIAVARLIQRKRISSLLRALALLERGRFRLEVVGEGPSEDFLRALAAELGVSGDVHFAGALDRISLAERYRQADLFALVPSDEAFGNVFAEALASGLPIVGSRVGGIPELVSEGENGLLVPPDEPEILADAIRRLGDDPVLRREMGVRNRARAEATLGWPQMTDGYLRLYRELTSGRSESRAPAAVRTRP